MNHVTAPIATDSGETKDGLAEFHAATMALTNTQLVGNKKRRVFTKFLAYSLATLDSVFPGWPAPDRWVEETITPETGQSATTAIPVYDNAQLAWVQTAITQRIENLARSADKRGVEPASDWATLLESAVGGAGKYMALVKEFKDMFGEYLVRVGMTEAQVVAVQGYLNPVRLAEAAEAKQARVLELVTGFREALDEPAYFDSVFASLERATTEQEEIDF
jgi:hypothetical protein